MLYFTTNDTNKQQVLRLTTKSDDDYVYSKQI